MPNYTRAELKRQADEKLANDAAISAAAAKHAESIRPKRQPVENTWPADRWVGTRGIEPQNESERKMLDACDEQGVDWAEKKTRLLALRADMHKLKPAQVL